MIVDDVIVDQLLPGKQTITIFTTTVRTASTLEKGDISNEGECRIVSVSVGFFYDLVVFKYKTMQI